MVLPIQKINELKAMKVLHLVGGVFLTANNNSASNKVALSANVHA